jgi:hypothetical protein
MKEEWSDDSCTGQTEPHLRFSFSISLLFSLTSQGFWDPQMWSLHFTQDMKSSLVTEANPIEVVTVTVQEKKQSCSAAVSYFPWLSEASGICTPRVLAAYALCQGLLNKEFAVYGLLAELTSLDLIGKLLKWCLLTWLSATVYCLHPLA